jgi:prolipoprotein diacylglyceryl transferase
MNNNHYFVWDVDPVLFTIPEFQLPFDISIWGIILAVGLFIYGRQKLLPETKNRKGKKTEAVLAPKHFWALLVGSFVIGQLPFLLIDSPSISSIGPIAPRYYGLMFASAFIFGYMLEARFFRDAGRSQEDLDRLLIYVLIATVIGARLGHVIFYDLDYYLRNIHLIPAVWTGGLASHGAAIGIIIAMWLYAKKTAGASFLWVADRVVPAVAVGGMFIRTGNFFNHEIIGVPTDLPWAVAFMRNMQGIHVPVHPTMLYEALICVLIVIVLLWFYKKYEKNPPEGAMFGIFLVMLFTGRFLIEFTKETQADFMAGSTLDMGQLLSIPLVLYGIWLLWKKVDWKKSPPATSS